MVNESLPTLGPASDAELAALLARLVRDAHPQHPGIEAARQSVEAAVREVLHASELLVGEEQELDTAGSAKRPVPRLSKLAAARVQLALEAGEFALMGELGARAGFAVAVEPPAAGPTLKLETEALSTAANASLPEVRLRIRRGTAPDTILLLPDELVGLLGALLHGQLAQTGARQAAPTRWDPSALVGRVLHTYQLERQLGRGGFGAVFEARDARPELAELRYAVKVLDPQKFDQPSDRESFLREFKNTQRCRGDHIIATNQVETSEDGLLFYSMELLAGEDLEKLVRREGRLPAARTGRILLQILEALRVAHVESGGPAILHLDLKPSNVFVVRPASGAGEGQVKVLDFGISQHAGGDPAREITSTESGRIFERTSSGRLRPVGSGLTTEGATISATRSRFCTPAYASPEHCAHWDTSIPDARILPLDGRSDLYSLGVIGFRLLTGKMPFDPHELSTEELVQAKLGRDAPSVRSTGVAVPRRLAAFVDRCLARDRAQRWRDAAEAHAELERIVHPKLTWKRAALVGAPLLALGLGVLAYFTPPKDEVEVGTLVRSGAAGALSADQPLYLSLPERASVELEWRGAPLGSGANVSFHPRSGGDEAAASRWKLEPSNSPSHFRLTCGAGRAEFVDAVGSLEAELPPSGFNHSGRRIFSPAFRVLVLDPAALRVPALAIPGAELRALSGESESVLDPLDLELAVDVQGASPAVLEPRLALSTPGVEALALAVDWKKTDAGASRALVAWDRVLAWVGSQRAQAGFELAVEVSDRAANLRRASARVRLRPGELTLQPALSAGGQPAAGRSLYPSDELALDVALDAPARVDWTLFEIRGGARSRICASGEQVAQKQTWMLSTACAALAASTRGRSEKWAEYELVIDASDAAAVVHAAGARAEARRTKRAVLPFRLYLQPVSLRAAIGDAPIEPGRPVYLQAGRFELAVTPTADIETAIVLHVSSGGHEIAAPKATGRASSPARFQLELPRSGRYELVIEGGIAADGDRAAAPDMRLEYALVLDTDAPRCERADAGGALVLDRKSGHVALVLRYQDASPGALAWTLPSKSGSASHACQPGEQVEIALDAQDFAADGSFELEATPTDAAGRSGERLRVPFVVAQRPPEVELVAPAASQRTWTRSGDAWTLVVRVSDANGLDSKAKLMASLTGPAGLAPLERELRPSPASLPGKSATHEATWLLDAKWSRAEVGVRVRAVDTFGNATPDAELARFELEEIERKLPACIEWPLASAARLSSRMRLVRGNGGAQGGDYLFRGESDRAELARAAEAGFTNLTLKADRLDPVDRSWALRFPAGEIADYYLDEREVRNAEFLEFLAQGAPDARVWPANPSNSKRIGELRAALGARGADLPVVGITWDEAAAFARWAKKRLPSIVEWEYALRGGREYRTIACYGGAKKGRADLGRVVIDAPRPLPVGTSRDQTPGTSLWDLSGNVREWTATPETFDDQRESPLQHATRFRRLLLRPEEFPGLAKRDSFWIAGASFQTSAPSEVECTFFGATYLMRQDAQLDTGFRCAVTATDELLDRMSASSGADLDSPRPAR